MRLLLDTHAAAWWWLDNPRLPAAAANAIRAAREVFVSAVTVFEFSTRHRLARWPEIGVVLSRLPELMDEARFLHVPVTAVHGHVAGALNVPHRDPFDRLLAAQSQVEALTLVSADPAFSLFAVARPSAGPGV